jgi:hypothetical protein
MAERAVIDRRRARPLRTKKRAIDFRDRSGVALDLYWHLSSIPN